MKAAIFVIVCAVSLTLGACGGKPKTKVAVEEAKAGRDQELFRTAVATIKKGQLDTGRYELNTLMNTYPDSQLAAQAKLIMADTFYIEGGSKNLAQAEAQYRDWLQFFPDSPISDDVRIKIAEIHMRQFLAPDRDITQALMGERELKEMLRVHPDSPKKAEVEQRIREIEEILGMHELGVAHFYYDMRKAPAATQGRTEEILNKYPNFSRFDEALYLHARAMADQEDTETASQDLARIVKFYPKGPFSEKAKALLETWKKPVPEPDAAKLAEPLPDTKGFIPKVFTSVFGSRIENISSQGVIIDRTMTTEEIVARAADLAGVKNMAGPVTPGSSSTTNNPNARPRRAGQPGQDVEVKPANGQNGNDKDSKKKNSNSSSEKNP